MTAAAAALADRLDTILVEYFSVFSLVRVHRAQLAARLSAGFFSFEQARFSQPNIALDQSAYSGRDMKCSVTCALHTDGTGQLVPVSGTGGEGDTESASEASDDSAPKSTSRAIRQRVFTAHLTERDRKLEAMIEAAHKRGKGEPVDEADDDDDESAPPTLDLSRTPLLWFGVLTPPQVRAAQREFSAALTDVAAVAAAQIKLTTLADEFESLMAEKRAHDSESLSAEVAKLSVR